MMFDPGQHTVHTAPQWLHILGQQHQTERQHPDPEYRENAEHAAQDQQQPAGIRTLRTEGRRSQ
jgi:hypothetical protein